MHRTIHPQDVAHVRGMAIEDDETSCVVLPGLFAPTLDVRQDHLANIAFENTASHEGFLSLVNMCSLANRQAVRLTIKGRAADNEARVSRFTSGSYGRDCTDEHTIWLIRNAGPNSCVFSNYNLHRFHTMRPALGRADLDEINQNEMRIHLAYPQRYQVL